MFRYGGLPCNLFITGNIHYMSHVCLSTSIRSHKKVKWLTCQIFHQMELSARGAVTCEHAPPNQHNLWRLIVHHVKEQLASYSHITLKIYIKYPLHVFPLRCFTISIKWHFVICSDSYLSNSIIMILLLQKFWCIKSKKGWRFWKWI